MASNALATTPRDDAEANDTSPAEVGGRDAIRAPPRARRSERSRPARRARTRSPTSATGVYPEQGNGGYTSVHTDVFLAYDAPTNLFLPGTHVVLTDRATQCLTDFSLDFERTNANTGRAEHDRQLRDGERPAGDVRVRAADVPGRPERAERPRPAGARGVEREPRQRDEPEPARLLAAGQRQRPERDAVPREQARDHAVGADRRAATRSSCASTTRAGRASTSTATARPRAGSASNTTAAPNDGSFVTTEPVGTASWMPLNNHPSAKPTYDFYDTVNIGKTAIATGELVGAVLGPTFAPVSPTTVEPARRELPRRLVDVALALARADRELPRREQHRRVRPDRAHRRERHRLLPGAGQRDRRRAQGDEQDRHGQPGGHHELPDACSTARTRSRPRASSSASRPRASRRRCRRRSPSRAGRSAARTARRSGRSTTRTCTSGSATTSPRRRSTSRSGRRASRPLGEYLSTARTRRDRGRRHRHAGRRRGVRARA